MSDTEKSDYQLYREMGKELEVMYEEMKKLNQQAQAGGTNAENLLKSKKEEYSQKQGLVRSDCHVSRGMI